MSVKREYVIGIALLFLRRTRDISFAISIGCIAKYYIDGFKDGLLLKQFVITIILTLVADVIIVIKEIKGGGK